MKQHHFMYKWLAISTRKTPELQRTMEVFSNTLIHMGKQTLSVRQMLSNLRAV